MRTILVVPFLLLGLAACAPTHDEPVGNPGDLSSGGYKPVRPSRPDLRQITLPSAHSLAWPVAFQDASHQIGNAMAEYQPYDGSYWHGGCDLRVNAGAEVRAPVAGKVEAGHYSYVVNKDGSMTKYWLAWPASGNDTYFEVAVVTTDGTRYEFHHVNRTTLPSRIKTLLQNGGSVAAGDTLGYAIRWSDGVYHHIHYNVIASNGVRINPEFISETVADTTAPQITAAYAVTMAGSALAFGTGTFTQAISEFVVNVNDKLGVYTHPPQFAKLSFASGASTTWDFRATLTNLDGTFPNLWSFFKKSLTLPSGTIVGTSGGYGTGPSLIRLPVPAGARGDFTIEFADQNDNGTQLAGHIN